MSNYTDYLQTDYWKAVANAVKERADYKCQICNSPHDLTAHHRTYENRGHELSHLADLICLCRRCHDIFHGADKKERPLPKIGAGVMRAKQAEGMTQVTTENWKFMRCDKEPWHWYKDHGINPKKTGWMKRAIGREIPTRFFKQ